MKECERKRRKEKGDEKKEKINIVIHQCKANLICNYL